MPMAFRLCGMSIGRGFAWRDSKTPVSRVLSFSLDGEAPSGRVDAGDAIDAAEVSRRRNATDDRRKFYRR